MGSHYKNSNEAFILPDGTINPLSTAVVEAIPFDSSAVAGNLIMSDVASGFEIYADSAGEGDFAFSNGGNGSIDVGETYWDMYSSTGWIEQYDSGGSTATIGTINMWASKTPLGTLESELIRADHNTNGQGNTGAKTINSMPPIFIGGDETGSAVAGAGSWGSVAVAYTGTALDTNNALFTDEVRFDSANNTTVLSDVNSTNSVEWDATSGLYSFTNGTVSSEVYLDTDESSINWIDTADAVGAGYTAWSANRYTKHASNNRALSGGLGSGNAVFWAEDNVNTYSLSVADAIPSILSANGATVNAGVTNSLILGGVSVTADKDDYAFCENLEVQGGLARYSATPTLGGDGFDIPSTNNMPKVLVSGSSSTTATTYAPANVDNIIFEGTDKVGTPTTVTFIAYTNTGTNGGSVKLIDKTNGDAVIAEVTGITSTSTINMETDSSLANLPTGKAVLHIEYKAGTGETFKIRGCSMI